MFLYRNPNKIYRLNAFDIIALRNYDPCYHKRSFTLFALEYSFIPWPYYIQKMMLFITRSWYSCSEWEMVWVKARMKRKETEDYPKQSILNQLDRESLDRSMINKHLLILWCAAQRCLMMYQKIKTHAKVITYIVIHVYNFKTIPKMFGYDTVR